MPTYYVEDYDGERNDDAVETAPAPVVETKVVDAPESVEVESSGVEVETA
jgi:hypothetical protein